MALGLEVSQVVRSVVAEMLHTWHLSMIDFFARPWEISGPGKPIDLPRSQVDSRREMVRVSTETGHEWKTFQEMRQQKYERIVDETLFIARASEGAVSAEWVMEQPIFIRTKYVEQLDKELQERQKQLNKKKK